MQAGERRKISRGEQIEDEARRKRGCDIVKKDSRSARGAGREQRRVTLQHGRRQPAAADKTKLLEAGGSTLVGQRPKENDHKHSKRSKEKG